MTEPPEHRHSGRRNRTGHEVRPFGQNSLPLGGSLHTQRCLGCWGLTFKAFYHSGHQGAVKRQPRRLAVAQSTSRQPGLSFKGKRVMLTRHGHRFNGSPLRPFSFAGSPRPQAAPSPHQHLATCVRCQMHLPGRGIAAAVHSSSIF